MFFQGFSEELTKLSGSASMAKIERILRSYTKKMNRARKAGDIGQIRTLLPKVAPYKARLRQKVRTRADRMSQVA